VVGAVRYLRILGMCMVAVFAIAAVTATGASAEKLPAWGQCEASETHEGKYADAGCTEPVKKVYGKTTGGYEWHPLEGEYHFRNGEIGPTTFETTNGKKIQCAEGALEGRQRVEAPNRVSSMLVTFEGCESEGRECLGLTNLSNWLEEEAIEGKLVYLSGEGTTSPTVGLTLTTEVPGQPLYKTVACEGELGSVEIGGAGAKKAERPKGNAVIGVVSPVDVMTTEYTQTFNQTAGVQEPMAAEKGKAKSLQMFLSNEFKWVQMGLTSTFAYFSERELPPIEIKAVI
jgi:hypothetical protein